MPRTHYDDDTEFGTPEGNSIRYGDVSRRHQRELRDGNTGGSGESSLGGCLFLLIIAFIVLYFVVPIIIQIVAAIIGIAVMLLLVLILFSPILGLSLLVLSAAIYLLTGKFRDMLRSNRFFACTITLTLISIFIALLLDFGTMMFSNDSNIMLAIFSLEIGYLLIGYFVFLLSAVQSAYLSSYRLHNLTGLLSGSQKVIRTFWICIKFIGLTVLVAYLPISLCGLLTILVEFFSGVISLYPLTALVPMTLVVGAIAVSGLISMVMTWWGLRSLSTAKLNTYPVI
jgi:hypothetical protein